MVSNRVEPASVARTCQYGKDMSPLIRSLLFLALYTVYILVGGYMFNAIECPQEIAIKKKVAAAVKDEEFENLLIFVSSYFERFGKGLQNETQLKLNHTPSYNKVEREDFACKTWSVYNSVFFAFTCITTIGYGTQTPTTQAGRAACLFYSIIGIPINSILICFIGNVFKDQESIKIEHISKWMIIKM